MKLAAKIFAVACGLIVALAVALWALGLTGTCVLLAYTFIWVAVGEYLKARTPPAPVPEPANDIAIAELVSEQAREIRDLQQSNHELREQISEFVPHRSHFASQSRCHDGQSLFEFELTYIRRVAFRQWPHAQQAIKQFRADAIMAHVAQDHIDRAHGRRTLA